MDFLCSDPVKTIFSLDRNSVQLDFTIGECQGQISRYINFGLSKLITNINYLTNINYSCFSLNYVFEY